MDRNRVNHVPKVESTASQSAGLLELWHGTGQVVWHHAGVCCAGLATGLQRSESAATLAGMVLWCQRQKRGQAPGTGRKHVFWTVAAVDPGLVARGSAATGLGLRCDDVEETLYRAGDQRGVSGLCHSGGVESGGCGAKGRLATVLAGPAAAPGGQCARALDGDRDSGSRLLCRLVVCHERVAVVA